MTSDNNDEKSKDIADIAFGEALEKALSTDADRHQSSDSEENLDQTIEKLIAEFEGRSQVDEDGNEFWFARDLMQLLGYSKWDNFLGVVGKAKAACEQSEHRVEDHFAGVGKMVTLGSGAKREIDDIVLSRYACYLVAQNADASKRPVAFAQTYFAIQTRRQEIRDQEEREYQPLTEDERRLMLREEIKTHNKHLASAAKNAGVRDGLDYAIFQTEGYKGRYGGLDVPGIRRRKGLTAKKAILDHMGSTELAANLFRATQTEEKLRRDGIKGKVAANRAHHEVGAKVRQTIKDIGGTMPEDLEPAEDIKKVGRRVKKALKKSTKAIDDGSEA